MRSVLSSLVSTVLPDLRTRTAAIAALLFLVCLALLAISETVRAGEQPQWLKKDTTDRLFPQSAAYTGPLSGKPPAMPVYSAGRPIGFLFSTDELTDVVGFSGTPFNFVVGLDLQGNITGVVLVEHSEPIIDYNHMGAQLTRFIEQYAGLAPGGSITLSGQGTPGGIDGISGATVSARAFNHAIVQSARLVARSRGLAAGAASSAMIDTASFQPLTWSELIAAGAIERIRILHDGEVGTADQDVALELQAAVVNPASIGRNLLGPMRYGEHVAPYGPQDLIVLLMGKGPYSFVGTRVFDTGTFDRVRIEQGARTFVLERKPKHYQYLPFVSAKGAPKFDEIYLFRIPAERGINVLAPWQVVVVMGDGSRSGAKTREFKLSYSLPSRFVLPPAEPSAEEPLDAPWREAWRAQAGNIVVLGFGLLLLTGLLIAMHRLTRQPRFYQALRVGFLLFTLVWIGWIAGAQLSIINVFAWLGGLINGNGLAVFLADLMQALEQDEGQKLGGKSADEARRTGAIDTADDQVEALFAPEYQTVHSPAHRAVWDRGVPVELFQSTPPQTPPSFGVMKAQSERAVREGQALGVRLLELDARRVRGGGAVALGVGQHVRGQVDAHDARPGDAFDHQQRDVPRSGADVEHVPAGAQLDQALDESGVGTGVVHGVVAVRLRGRVHGLRLERPLHAPQANRL